MSAAVAFASLVNVPVIFAIRPALPASPTWTTVPALMFAAVKLEVVTARIVCTPVKYCPAVIVWLLVETL